MSHLVTDVGAWKSDLPLEFLVTETFGADAYLHDHGTGQVYIYGRARYDTDAWTVLATVTDYGE